MTTQQQSTDRIRAHVVTELPLYVSEWERYVHWMDAPSSVADEGLLVRLAHFAQLSRGLSRLLALPLCEVSALCMEALLTFSLCGGASYDAALHGLMRRACRCLRDVLALSAKSGELPPERIDPLRRELFDVARRLLLGTEETVRRAYDGPCVVYPIRSEDGDPAPLRVRGFDLLRVEREGLSMYLLDYAWENVLARGSGVGGLLAFLARSGHVLDVCSINCVSQDSGQDSGQTTELLRLVFASPLDQDFVEALTRIPSNCVHVINPARVRRYEASWQAHLFPSAHHVAPANGTSLDDLVAVYDQAMAELFATARSEHGKSLFFGPGNLSDKS